MMIREMQKDDIPAVMEIWLETNCRAHAFIPAEYWKSNVPYVTEALQQAEVYVYEKQDKILGFAGINDTYIEGIFGELLRLIEVTASYFNHYCTGCDFSQRSVLHNVHRRIRLGYSIPTFCLFC